MNEFSFGFSCRFFRRKADFWKKNYNVCFSGLNPSEDEVRILVLNHEQCTNCKSSTLSADYIPHHENSYARDSFVQHTVF